MSVNTADPSNLTIASSVNDNWMRINGLDQVVLHGNYAYVASSWRSSLLVFDITDPTNLTVAAAVQDSNLLNGARGIHIVGDLAYMVTSNSNSDIAVGSSTRCSGEPCLRDRTGTPCIGGARRLRRV